MSTASPVSVAQVPTQITATKTSPNAQAQRPFALPVALERIIEQEKVESRVKLLPIGFLEPVEIFTVFLKETVSLDLVARYNDAFEAAQRHQSYLDYVRVYGTGAASD